MDNLEIYNKSREVPAEAKKTIGGGKLKGFTDINAMWRIKKLTELFGACGKGWWTTDVNFRLENGAKGEIAAFCTLNLITAFDGKEGNPIFGVGGSGFVNMEKGQLVTNDECFKMAYTDALSVACKALGIGADVYFEKDASKYLTGDTPPQEPTSNPNAPPQEPLICEDCGKDIKGYGEYTAQHVAVTTKSKYGVMVCAECGAIRKIAEVEMANGA